ncbi:MAG: carboxypeptidase-like regulatory domain-containing protein [Planctomycetota bacterium]
MSRRFLIWLTALGLAAAIVFLTIWLQEDVTSSAASQATDAEATEVRSEDLERIEARRIAGTSKKDPIESTASSERGAREASPDVPPGPGRIEGAVVSSDSETIGGARIRVREKEGRALTEVTADADGHFVLEGLPVRPTEMTLLASAKGFVPIDFDFALPKRQPEFRDVVLRLPGGRDLTGLVLDEKGHALVDALVWISWQSNDQSLRRARFEPVRTGDDGHFEIEGAPRVDLLVWAWTPGYAVRSVSLGLAQAEVDVVLPEQAAALARLRIEDEDGQPLAGAEVSLKALHPAHETAGFGGNEVTDTSATVVFGPLPAIEYRLRVTLGEKVFAVHEGRGSMRRMKLVAGDENAHTIRALGTHALRGRLLTRAGEAVPHVTVRATVNRQSRSFEARTDAAGQFQLELPGRSVEHDKVTFQLPEGTHDPYPDQELTRPLDGEAVEIRIASRATISGRIVGVQGQAVSGAVINVRRGEARPMTELEPVRSREEGEFEVDVPAVYPEGVRLEAHHPDAGAGRSKIIHPKPGERLAGLSIVLSGNRVIFGRVQREDGSEVPGGGVRVVRLEVGGSKSVRADLRGEFRLEGLWDGMLRLEGEYKGVWYAAAEPVNFSGPDELGPIAITVTEPWVLEGIVQTTSGEPFEGAQVSVREERNASRVITSEFTSSSGQFQMALPGDRAVWVTVQGLGLRAGQRVYGPRPEIIEVELSPGCGFQKFTLESSGLGSLRGALSLPEGFSNASLVIQFEPLSSREPSRHVLRLKEGSFELEHVWAGDYELVLENPLFTTIRFQVTIAPGKETDLGRLTPELGEMTRLVIVDSSGVPIEGVQIAVSGEHGGMLDLVSDASGRVEAPLVVEEGFEIVYWKTGYAFARASLNRAAFGGETKLMLPRAATLRLRPGIGRDWKFDLDWIEGIVAPHNSEVHFLGVDEDGSDRISGKLPPGTYRIRAWDSSVSPRWPGPSPGRAIEKIVELKEGEELLVELTE